MLKMARFEKAQPGYLQACFGSLIKFSSQHLVEITKGLEESQQDFIKKIGYHLPEGFKERMDGKGLIIRGWAPQVLILTIRSVEL